MNSVDDSLPACPCLPIPIPAGRYALSRDLDDAIRRSAGAPAGDGTHAHPIMAFVAALGGMGISVAAVCRLCGSSIDRGPVLARTLIRFDRPIEVNRDYAVAGSVTRIVRKASRRYGVADHVTLGLAVSAAAESFAAVELTWVMPVDQP